MVWLNECLRGHEKCRADEDSGFQPPRLVSVSEKAIHLVDSAVAGRYATLSYCWGSNPTHLTLTAEKLDSFRGEICSEKLPQTFRDAIAFTRALGISYIWIDALCILQTGERSAEDWQNHLTLMASIYANGVVNLSASSSQDAHGGLGVPSGPFHHPPILSVRDENRHEKEQFMLVDLYRSKRTSSESPIIDTRGWVTQERILSPRVIDFTAGKVFWQCLQGTASELCPYGRPYTNTDFSWRPLLSGGVPVETWHAIVEEYSKRKLTIPSDKFPAIAGIAAKFADIRKDEYFAGHFSSTLPQSLLWSRSHGYVKRVEGAYVAPSWSWASIAGQIDAGPRGYFGDERAVAKVKEIGVGLEDPRNRFGQITSGSIVLEGPLLENQQFENQQYDYVTQELGKTPVWWQPAEGKMIRELSSRTNIALDVARDTLDVRALSLFCITPTKGLVLVKLDRNTYERVGIYKGPFGYRLKIANRRPWQKVKIV